MKDAILKTEVRKNRNLNCFNWKITDRVRISDNPSFRVLSFASNKNEIIKKFWNKENPTKEKEKEQLKIFWQYFAPGCAYLSLSLHHVSSTDS